MPLASWASLHFNGPAAAAMVTSAVVTSDISLRGAARANSVTTAAATAPLLKATRLRNSPVFASGAGSMVAATPKARGRLGMVSRVNALSQDDVTGAVLESEIEPGMTLRQALRIVTAAMAGKVSGAAGTTVTIRDVNDTTNRIVATVDANGNRSAVTLDAS